MSRRIPPQLRRLVWEKYMKKPDKTYGPCFVCNNIIHLLQFECGHVISHSEGGSLTVENLRPICGSCNKSMGTQNLYDYKKKFFEEKTNKRSKPKSAHKSTIEEITLGFTKLSISGDSMPPVPTLRMEKSPLIDGCQHILLRGKRKGEKCNKKIYDNGYCKDHSKIEDIDPK